MYSGGTRKIEKIDFSTVDEILDDILKTVPLNFQEEIKKMTIDEFVIKQHFSFGIWIRKRYFHQNPNKEQLIANLGYQKDTLFLDGDRFSYIILRKLYERIVPIKNNKKIDGAECNEKEN